MLTHYRPNILYKFFFLLTKLCLLNKCYRTRHDGTACNPSTKEPEAVGSLQFQDQPAVHSEDLIQKKNTKTKNEFLRQLCVKLII